MKRESKTQFALLGVLTQCEMSGYEIKKFIETSLNFFWNESYGQIYPTLKKMEDEGLVTSTEVPSDGGKSKILYKITAQGKKELQDWLHTPPAKTQTRNEVLLRLFFGRNIPTRILLEQMQEIQKSLEMETSVYRKIIEDINNDFPDHPDRMFWMFTLDYGLETLSAGRKWIKRVLAQLQEQDNKLPR